MVYKLRIIFKRTRIVLLRHTLLVDEEDEEDEEFQDDEDVHEPEPEVQALPQV